MSETNPPNDSAASDGPGVSDGRPLDYAPHPPKSPFRRGLAASRRWMRDTFSREQLVAGLKQLAWVAPMTLLVWVWAEREQTTTRDVRFTVELRSDDPRKSVQLRDPSDGVVSAALNGPRARLEELRRELAARMGAVRFEVPPDLKEGEYPIPVSAIVGRDDRFDGITVSGSEPTRVTIYVDTIVEETLPVEVRQEDQALFENVRFTPEKVKVSLPRQTRENMLTQPQSGGKLVVYADLAGLPDKTPGRKTDVSGVRVYVPNAEGDVVVGPSTVSASLTVRNRAKEHLIESVPVLENGANRLLHGDPDPKNKNYGVDVSYDPLVLFDVRVVGPPDAIDEIARLEGANVTAQVTIEDVDVDAGPKRKAVRFLLPEGVKLHPDDAKQEAKTTVMLTVTRRTAPQ